MTDINSQSPLKQTNRPDAINFLRVLATMMVFGQHLNVLSENAMLTMFIGNFNYGFLFRCTAWAGVWIFFLISGYLAGKGFADGRYDFSLQDIKKYYSARILKTWLPAFVFCIIEMFFDHTNSLFHNPKLILKMITCTFNGQGGYSGMGHTWYIFMIMWFYLVTPLFALCANKIMNKAKEGKKLYYVLMILIIAVLIGGGCLYRVMAAKNRLNWYKHIYTPPYANIDLFLSGLFFSYLIKDVQISRKSIQTALKIVSAVLLIALVLTNEWIYLFTRIFPEFSNLYRFIFPSFYCIFVLFYLFSFNQKTDAVNRKLSWKAVCKNPLRLIDVFSNVSFYAYLFHMIVSYKLKTRLPDEKTPLVWILYILSVTIVASILGYMYSKAFQFKKINVMKKNKRTIEN